MSRLLPKSHDDFRSRAYWDSFFKARQASGGTFEWYGEWRDLEPALGPLLSPSNAVLVVGCGNSALSADLYNWGVRNITNVDFSAAVIAEMRAKNTRRPEMQWVEGDVTALPFADAAFDVVIDKGMLDAMAAEDTPVVLRDVQRMFGESDRVLRPGGLCVCVSLAQTHVLREALAFPIGTYSGEAAAPPPPRGYTVDVSIVSPSASEASSLSPVLLLARKPPVPSSSPNLLRLAGPAGSYAPASPEAIADHIRESQWLNGVRRAARVVSKGNTFKLDVWSEGAAPGSPPRYSITAVDVSRKQSCGVLLVPQGREHEWSFGNPDGMASVVEGASVGRLYFVYLNRGHSFPSQEAIKDELSGVIQDLAPTGCTGQIPFLAVSDDLGSRAPVCERTSAISGEFVIEDVSSATGRGPSFRRMFFRSNLMSVQSEARLLGRGKGAKARKGAPATVAEGPATVDHSYLEFEYHVSIVAGLSFLLPTLKARRAGKAPENVRVLVVGLGGGLLPMFLHTHFDVADVTSIELDPAVKAAAVEFFGFREREGEREGGGASRVIVADGLDVVRAIAARAEQEAKAAEAAAEASSEAAAAPAEGEDAVADVTAAVAAVSVCVPSTLALLRQHMIVIDVDCKDMSLGMPFPPQEFMTPEFLSLAHTALAPGGLLVLNVACRTQALFDDVIKKLSHEFPVVYEVPSPGTGLNKVLYCLADVSNAVSLADVHTQCRALATVASRPWSSDVDVPDSLSGLLAVKTLVTGVPPAPSKTSKKKKGKRK